jgi:FKBP-type peptidyl-prolyl cis-trans isomerase
MNRTTLSRPLRVALLALALGLAVTAAGCGSTSSSQPSSSNSTAPSTTFSSTEPAPSQQPTSTEASSAPAQPQAPEKLQIKDLKKGKGPAAKTGDTVSMEYTGWLTDGTVFDSNVGKAPFTFKIGNGDVIPGWDQGIPGMKVGGERQLIIPPSLGYGAQGTPGGPIPPNATLKFQVKLLSIQ